MIALLGNIGDFAGGIGVLISLVYLAIQVRRNTTYVKAESVRGILSRSADFLEYVASDAELTDLFVRGTRETDSLSPEQQARLGLLMAAMFRQLEAVFRYRERGMLDDSDWEGIRHGIHTVSRLPFVLKWWAEFSPGYSRNFQALIESFQGSNETRVAHPWQLSREQ